MSGLCGRHQNLAQSFEAAVGHLAACKERVYFLLHFVDLRLPFFVLSPNALPPLFQRILQGRKFFVQLRRVRPFWCCLDRAQNLANFGVPQLFRSNRLGLEYF